MFKVKDKHDGQIFTVYDIKIIDGGTKFLIYCLDSWFYLSANDYEPI